MHQTGERDERQKEEIDMRIPSLVAISINNKFLSFQILG